jgi:hypothetical protein
VAVIFWVSSGVLVERFLEYRSTISAYKQRTTLENLAKGCQEKHPILLSDSVIPLLYPTAHGTFCKISVGKTQANPKRLEFDVKKCSSICRLEGAFSGHF